MSVDQAVRPKSPSMNKATKVYLVLLALALVAAAGLGLYTKFVLNRDHVDNAKVGDCLRDAPDDKDVPYRIVVCGDAAAAYKALAVLPRSGSCMDVAGASKSVSTDEHHVCLGRKDVDPAKAINVAKEGDCLDMSGTDPQRVDCADPKATKKVLKRATDVMDFQLKGTCAVVPGADSSYSWDWEAKDDPMGVNGLTVDVLLCLGKK